MSERPRSSDQALEQARLAIQHQRPGDAERLAADVLESDPANIGAAQALGTALLMQDRPGEAIAPLEMAARRSDDPVIETLFARALARAGRGDEAFDLLRRTTARRPAFALAFRELGDQLGAIGRFDEGVAVLESGLALLPDATVLRVGLGNLQLQRNDRTAARRLFLQVRAAEPGRHDALVGLGRVMALDGEHAAAAELYRRALELRPDDATTRIELGKSLLEMGDRQGGEATLRAVAGGAGLAGPAIMALAATSHGRFFLRPSAAARFLGARMA
jgi:tetratricopeptide (TPR) repeat protein